MATLKYRDSNGNFITIPTVAGPAGVGIQSITQTASSSASGGNNVWTATMTNGTTATFTVKNGAQGPKGDKGDTGGIQDVAASSTKGYITVTNANGTTKDVPVGDPNALLTTGGTVTGTTTIMNVKFFNDTVTSGTSAGNRSVLAIMGDTYGNDSAYIKTNGKLSFGDPGPQIQFIEGTDPARGQRAALIYSDHDTIHKGNSLSLVSTENDCAFIAPKVYGAVWNDYAEYRVCKEHFISGQVVFENGDDTLSISNERLQRGCSIISDTFGFAIGETDEAKCPIAVSGRVLAYGYESREEFKKHIGWPVCSGPNGTVSIMSEEEEEKYPSRIIGTISAIPEYDTWGTGKVKVNGRIWIKVV